jgi:hypothetical protein
VSAGGQHAAPQAQVSVSSVGGSLLQRCGGHQCPEGTCDHRDGGGILRRTAAGSASPSAPPLVHEVLRSPGRPLEASTRAFMESALGHDLGSVRIHSDRRAAESARAVSALAYTVGSHVVFGEGTYQPDAEEGRRLLAHELTHVVQQAGAAVPSTSLSVGKSDDPAEGEAEAIAQGVPRDRWHDRDGPPGNPTRQPHPVSERKAEVATLRRRLVIDPPGAVSEIESDCNEICPQEFPPTTPAGGTIESHCSVKGSPGCECLCDVTSDPTRTYTIQVQPATVSYSVQMLAGRNIATIPVSSVMPHTTIGPNPTTQLAQKSGSNVEFGFFKSDGSAEWFPSWRLLEHEVCGHGRLQQTYAGGRGNRPQHDVTIDTENTIAAEHGQPPRGHFSDRHQGESFYNPMGNRSRVVYSQVDGLHFEAP